MLNPALDIAAHATPFSERGRVQIPGLLEPAYADTLEGCLSTDVPWGLSVLENGKGRTFKAEELQQMQRADWQKLMLEVQNSAREGYQFIFNSYQMVTAWKERRDPELLLHPFFEFLNSAPMLDFAREVTGCRDIAKADAQATRYLPGHFLRRHDDFGQQSATDSRLVAYVLNLSRDWHADWGGLLQFMDENERVTESWVPRFNSLSLFKVPAWHCVSCVAPYATAPRLAITGWFRSH
ncbi:MAG: 2OG-Fe(II) oxygenase family protein [Gammaproteobacteria bacterium]